jgi:hypothetical protein
MPKRTKNYEELISRVTPDAIELVLKWQQADSLTTEEALSLNARELAAQKKFIEEKLAEPNPEGVILAD